MKLIWHILKKDIVRDRWGLFIWGLLFVLQVAVGLVARSGWVMDKHGHFMLLQTVSSGLVFLQMGMGYVLVARLVQADPLVGSAAFWSTRPISVQRLFLAKALASLLLFALLPVLLLLPWWIYCSFEWRAIFLAAVETMSWQVLMIAPAFLVASLTDDLGRVLLWTLLLVIGFMSWTFVLQMVVERTAWSPLSGAAGISFTRSVVVTTLFVIVATGVSMHQYLTRRWVRSVGLLALGLGFTVLTGKLWAWDWLAEIKGLTQKADQIPAGLPERLEFAMDEASVHVGSDKEKEREVHLNVPVRIQGLPPGMSLAAENVDHAWHWASGMVFNRDNYFGSSGRMGMEMLRKQFALPEVKADPETTAWHRARAEEAEAQRIARGLSPRPKPRNRPGSHLPGIVMRTYAPVPKSIVARMRLEPPAYEVSFRGILIAPEVLLVVSPKPGDRGSGGSNTIEVVELFSREDSEFQVRDHAKIVTTAPSVLREGLWFSGSSRAGRGFLREEILVVNRETGHMSWISDNRPNRGVLIGGVLIGWEDVRLGPPVVIRDGRSVLRDEHWLEHTSLVLVAEREAGRFEKTLRTERFAVEPEPNGADH